ncbi:MAG: alpha-amylase [Chitinophagaceae bacterium]
MANLTIFQFFHWYYSPEGNLWQHAADQAQRLASLGVTHVWLPPAYKSARGVNEPGYAVYDLYDIGQFDQKGTVRTRYGTRKEYLNCIKAFHNNGIQVIADIVLNHKDGGDEMELVPVQQVNPENRKEYIGGPKTIEAFTKFTFPGRKGKYSEFVWNWQSFTGIDKGENEIYLILNEHSNGQWEEMVEEEKGNFDYLMASDIEFRNPYVREELKKWGEWYIKTTKVDALRLDAVKHISFHFIKEWLDHIRGYFKKDFLAIGEYWRHDVSHLEKYIDATEGRVQLFDVPLHFNFYEASMQGVDYDLRKIFDGSLTQIKPQLSITFVDNHDTQPLQSLQSTVDYWFKPLAYALILLREQGIPCVFYPVIYEAKYADWKDGKEIYIELNALSCVENMLKVRKELLSGMQRDYFDHGNTVGWTKEGMDDNAISGFAVLISNGAEGNKKMEVGKRHSGKTFVDVCGNRQEKVMIDENGWAEFFVNERSASVWIQEEATKIFQ